MEAQKKREIERRLAEQQQEYQAQSQRLNRMSRVRPHQGRHSQMRRHQRHAPAQQAEYGYYQPQHQVRSHSQMYRQPHHMHNQAMAHKRRHSAHHKPMRQHQRAVPHRQIHSRSLHQQQPHMLNGHKYGI